MDPEPDLLDALRVRALAWAPYRLRFRAAHRTGSAGAGAENVAERSGVLMRVQSESGACGYGDAAPLPERGDGTADDLPALLTALGPRLLAGEPQALLNTLDRQRGEPGTTTLRCALDTAFLDAAAQAADVSLAVLLAGDGPAATRVPVNATITVPDPAQAVGAAARAREEGFGCVKLKVAVMASVDAEVRRIRSVRTALGPDVALRLDANGAWGRETASQILAAVADAHLEWVEQPLPPGDLSGARMLRETLGITIAADEAATSVEAVRRVLSAGAADVIVLKPVTLGGLRPLRTAAQAAHAHGGRCVVTTAMDSGVGVAAALQVAASLGEGLPPCGLATAALLEDDLLEEPLPVTHGLMPLPKGPGLGIRVREAALTWTPAE